MINNNNIDEVISLIEAQIKKFNVPYVTQISNEERDPFKTLVSTVLSSRTRDEVTKNASQKLFLKVKNPNDLMNLPIKEVEKLIYPVGFYRVKAKNLKKLGEELIKKYNGKIPDSIEELIKLPGVGRKTANLVVTLGFNKDGICVDTHVHRIVNRWGYVKTKTPKETEYALREKLPKKYWRKINSLLVAFGKNVCTPISPKCSNCKLNNICLKVNIKKFR
ncbi:endonuclease III [Candidatus Bathyarchaeota archaeon]|nr:endonuclease III [Candidatus Bathyarchaeota archaeon]